MGKRFIYRFYIFHHLVFHSLVHCIYCEILINFEIYHTHKTKTSSCDRIRGVTSVNRDCWIVKNGSKYFNRVGKRIYEVCLIKRGRRICWGHTCVCKNYRRIVDWRGEKWANKEINHSWWLKWSFIVKTRLWRTFQNFWKRWKWSWKLYNLTLITRSIIWEWDQ